MNPEDIKQNADETFTHRYWPNLRFTDKGLETLKRTLEWVNEPDFPTEWRECLFDRLRYLDEYGGETDDGQHRRFRVFLGWDWAPYSFSIEWWSYDSTAPGGYKYGWNGGLICHVSGTDPLSVSLVPQAWGIHT